jgi:hypothetical protein
MIADTLSPAIEIVEQGGPYYPTDLTIEYNTAVNTRLLITDMREYDATPDDIVVRYNVAEDDSASYSNSTATLRMDIYSDDTLYTTMTTAGVLTIDNNAYYNTQSQDAAFAFFASDSYGTTGDLYTFANWQSTEGFDANSIVADPVLNANLEATNTMVRAIFLILLLATNVFAWDSIGLNFRASSAYVTDGTGETYVLKDEYPTTRGGVTFGYSDVPVSVSFVQSRDRSTSVDQRLAGMHQFSNNGDSWEFRVALDAAGTWEVCLALGDAEYGRTNQLKIYDDTTLLDTINGSSSGGQFVDTDETTHYAASWPDDNTCVEYTFSSTTANFVLDSSAGGDTGLAHIYLAKAENYLPDFVADLASQPTSWREADFGITKDGSNYVSAWADQAGLTADFVQATGANQPELVTLASGHKAVKFDGSDDIMTSTSTVGDVFAAGAKSQYLVFYTPTTGAGQSLFGGAITSIRTITLSVNRLSTRNKATDSTLYAATNTIVADTIYVYGMQHDNTTLTSTLNGAIGGDATGTTTTASLTDTLRVGADTAGVESFYGGFLAIITFDEVLSASDNTAVLNYLTAKYRGSAHGPSFSGNFQKLNGGFQ